MPALIRLALLCLLLVLPVAERTAHAERQDPLPPAQAFGFDAAMDGGDALITYDMPEGIYLYQHRILLTTATSGMRIIPAALPAGTSHEDEFFGKSTVYYGQLTLRAAVQGDGEFTLQVFSQGCDEQIGICYPPQKNTARLVAVAGASSGGGGADSTANDTPDDYHKDEAGYLARHLAGNSLFWNLLVFFVLGVGLSFTPCVLPMLPILLGVIGGGNKSRRQITLLTLAYIAGVTLAFTAFGVFAALSGKLLAAFFQQPWVLAAVALLFVALAASLFGAYELRLPAAAQQRLAAIGSGGSGGGAFLMGVVSAVAVSPCVAAPLVGALLYIGTSGDVLSGGLALFSLALGMSVLLAAAGIAGSRVLPQAGDWMAQIKHLFGALLLGVAVWVAAPLLPVAAQMIGYGLLLIFAALLAKPFHARPQPLSDDAPVTLHLIRTLALAALLWGAAMIIGAAAGSRDILTPLSPFTGGAVSAQGMQGAQSSTADYAAVEFQPIESLADLNQHTARAATLGAPVMLDFYADWCISCKEFERFTLRDPRVMSRLRDVALLRADVTANTAQHQELLAHFGLFGPPAILFFHADGEPVAGVRVIGYENADEFLRTLAAAGI